MSIIFGQDNKFTPAKIPTAVTPFQGVETVPVINVAPKVSALDHFYEFDKNFQRTFDIFSKAIESKSYSLLDELETKRNKDIVDGLESSAVASRHLQRHAEIAEKGLIPSRTQAHKKFTESYAKAQGGNVEAIALTSLKEFQQFVRDNPYNEREIRSKYDKLAIKYEGSQVWEALEPNVRPVIDALDEASRKRSLNLAHSQLQGEVEQEFQERFGDPNSARYIEGMRDFFATTGVTQDENGNYDFLAAGHSFKSVILDPVLKQMQEDGLLDAQTYTNLEDTLGEALVPIVKEALDSVRAHDMAIESEQRQVSKMASLRGNILNGEDASSSMASLLGEKSTIDSSTGNSILWTDNFEETLDEVLTLEDFTIPEIEGSTLQEIEAARNSRISRFLSLSTMLPEDIDTFLETYGSESALASISPTYAQFRQEGLEADVGPLQEDEIRIRPQVDQEYTAYRNRILDTIKDKLSEPILKTVESTLNAAYSRFPEDPGTQQRYFQQNIAPVLDTYFPEELERINSIFNMDSSGNFVARRYLVTDGAGNPQDIGVNLWQASGIEDRQVPTSNDFQLEERDGIFYIYPGIDNATGKSLSLDSYLEQGSDMIQFDSEEEAVAVFTNLLEQESNFIGSQIQDLVLGTEPNRTTVNLEGISETVILNDLELRILDIVTKHDDELTSTARRLRSASGRGGATAYGNLITGSGNVTYNSLATDDQRPAKQVSDVWFSSPRRENPQLDENWWNGLIRDFKKTEGIIRPEAVQAFQKQYTTEADSIRANEGLSDKDKEIRLAELDERYKTRIDAHVLASGFVLEYTNITQGLEGSAYQDAQAIFLNDDSQYRRLKEHLTALLRNEEGGEYFFDGNGNVKKDALFTDPQALNFLQQTYNSLGIAIQDEEVIDSYFGEFGDAVRKSLEHAAHGGTTVYRDENGHYKTQSDARYSNGVRIVSGYNLTDVVDDIVSFSLTTQEDIDSFILAEGGNTEDLVQPAFLAMLSFLQDPSYEGGSDMADVTRSRITAQKDSYDFSLGFTKGMRDVLEAKGVDPDILGSLLDTNNELNQFFKDEFRIQLTLRLGEKEDEFRKLMGQEDVQGRQTFFEDIIRESHQATLTSTFGENSPFIFINGDGLNPIMIRMNGPYSPSGMIEPNQSDDELMHASKTFNALDARRAEYESRGARPLEEGTSRYAPVIVRSNLTQISNVVRGEKLPSPTNKAEAVSVIADGLSLFSPSTEENQIKANEIVSDIGEALSFNPSLADALDISTGFDIDRHNVELAQKAQERENLILQIRADGEFIGATQEEVNAMIDQLPPVDGVTSAVLDVISDMNVMHLVYFNERVTGMYGSDIPLNIGKLGSSQAYRFDFSDTNDRPKLQLTIPSNNSATGARYNFYFPKYKSNGNYIPINSFIPQTPQGKIIGSGSSSRAI